MNHINMWFAFVFRYGYVTNTKVKLFAVVSGGSGVARDAEVRSLLRNLHSLYADAICCPFYRPGELITSA